MFEAKKPAIAARYLRLSVTDACNFRCAYCLPEGCPSSTAPRRVLSPLEVRHLLSAMAKLGVEKVRITGGEPGLRADLADLVAIAAGTSGVSWTSLTTNGTALTTTHQAGSRSRAEALRKAGLRSINISLDSLNPETFTRISGNGSHAAILDAVESALEAGFEQVKINAVLMRDRNDQELDRWLGYIRARDLTVRFIELMPTEGSLNLYQGSYVSAQPIVLRLRSEGWEELPRTTLDGPARHFSHPDFRGRIGVITPISDDFCSQCNRVRVTADGSLHLCAFKEAGKPLRHLLGSAMQQSELIQTIETALAGKSNLCGSGQAAVSPFSRNFSRLGG
jgi:cyclic pyranopterin phosphate synthase